MDSKRKGGFFNGGSSTANLRQRTGEYDWEALHSLKELFRKHTDVSLKLARQVLSVENEKNAVCSPLSIHVVLSLIAVGSNGQTLDQLLSFLKSSSIEEIKNLSSKLISIVMVDGSESGGPKLSTANGAWIDQSISLKPSFKQVADDVFKTGTFLVDFQHKVEEVVTQVNSWVDQKTNGLIKDVLSSNSVTRDMRLIFANCLYFNGKWDDEFDPEHTKDDIFHLMNGSTVNALFMTNRRQQLISCYDGFKVLRLSYMQGYDTRQFSMYIFLPDARDGLPSLMERVVSQTDFLDKHIPTEKVVTTRFMVPKFKISTMFDVSKTLKSLGVSILFNRGGLAEMSESQELFVSDIVQKAFIEVNERGTEAAAVTLLFAYGSCGTPPAPKVVDFVADHPFMFLIRENKSGVVMFVGHVMNPNI